VREMVLNHASVMSADAGRAIEWLPGLARGMAALVEGRVTSKSLRMTIPLQEIRTRSNGPYAATLHDLFLKVRKEDRDAYLFLMSLAQRAPLDEDLDSGSKDRLLACESLTLSDEIARPILLCAIKDWIAVGLPSSPEWVSDQLSIEFEQLLDDGELELGDKLVDNLACQSHAAKIMVRHRRRRLAEVGPAELWSQREQLFPSLLFGPEIERHLRQHWALHGKIIPKLLELDASASAWNIEDSTPRWRTKVTSESASTMGSPKLREARRFQSVSGSTGLFELHARVGSGFRIHFRVEVKTRCVEIGYVGPHLPI